LLSLGVVNFSKDLVMVNKTALRLKKNIDKILTIWEERVNIELPAAIHQETYALRNSLPEYLLLMVDALSNGTDRTAVRKRSDKTDSRIGRKHGEERAGSKDYTIDQLISEYHILRQVLCDVLEEEVPLTDIEREVIICSIEQAVNDAATEFTDTIKGFKQKIAMTLTHDLRTPLTSIKISAELLLRKLKSDELYSRKLDVILNNMNRLDVMITDLLNVSRLEAGESMPVEFNLCDLDLIVRQTIDELSLSFSDSFNVQSHGKCQGYWDEGGLRRVIENLVTNAIKYGDETKGVTVSLVQDKNSVELSVQNFGEPIRPENIDNLFEQYRRLKASADKPGWGIGLSMVKGMVEAHNGSISVKSSNEKGTTFMVKLPKYSRIESFAGVITSKKIVQEQVPQIHKGH
jgi:signal transduction histidine kinase